MMSRSTDTLKRHSGGVLTPSHKGMIQSPLGLWRLFKTDYILTGAQPLDFTDYSLAKRFGSERGHEEGSGLSAAHTLSVLDDCSSNTPHILPAFLSSDGMAADVLVPILVNGVTYCSCAHSLPSSAFLSADGLRPTTLPRSPWCLLS